jgi:two-component system, NarL family, invasion response regulator UvrY
MTRILIADDHAIVRQGLRSLLEGEFPAVEVAEALDARETIELLMRQPWDLVLLDINMPGRNGLEVLEEARRLHTKTPVLILSAYPESEFALRAFQLGASGYLNKQTAFDELLAAVRHVLAGGKYVTASLAEKMAATLGGEIRLAPHESLSSRELQVLRLIALGRTLKEISTELGVSEKTVATYRARISEKMGLGTKVELARYAMQHKLVE